MEDLKRRYTGVLRSFADARAADPAPAPPAQAPAQAAAPVSGGSLLGGTNGYILAAAVIGLLVAGAAVYYFFFHKPKGDGSNGTVQAMEMQAMGPQGGHGGPPPGPYREPMPPPPSMHAGMDQAAARHAAQMQMQQAYQAQHAQMAAAEFGVVPRMQEFDGPKTQMEDPGWSVVGSNPRDMEPPKMQQRQEDDMSHDEYVDRRNAMFAQRPMPMQQSNQEFAQARDDPNASTI